MLSMRDEATFSVEIEGQYCDWNLTTEEFEELLQAFFERIRIPLERTIRDARIDISQLDRVVLVGGTTRMPLIRKLVTRLFGRIPAMHLNRMKSLPGARLFRQHLKHDTANCRM